MADVYTPPPDSSYLLTTPFDMPTDNGYVWAVAFSSKTGTLITAALSVGFTLIFMLLWNLLCFIVVYASNRSNRLRATALVVLWNSNDAWFAFLQMLSYSFHSVTKTSEFLYGLALTFLAFAVFGGSLSLGVVGPSRMQIGNVAPARPSSVYYPYTPNQNDPVGVLKEFGLRAPGVLRALGSVEAAKVTLRTRVKITEDANLKPWNGREPMRQLKYSYSVTGVDLGLQHGSDLLLSVEGSCITEYGWVSQVGEDPDIRDVYKLWNLDDQAVAVPINSNDIRNAPKASFNPHPDAAEQYKKDGNSSFAVVVWSARRASITESSDPWYVTELRNTKIPAPFEAKFWMKRGRPALSCWQKDSWSYGSQKVTSALELGNVQGIKVPSALLEVLKAALANPVLSRLGNASGDSALRSRTTSPNGVIDAGASSMFFDMERLLVASFVATRNVFVDAVMFEKGTAWPNVVQAANGQPADGAADFVISSPDIQTFSVVGLIVLVCLLVALLLTETSISLCIRHYKPGASKMTGPQPEDQQQQSQTQPEAQQQQSQTQPEAQQQQSQTQSRTNEESVPKSHGLMLFKSLLAPQLFRRIYEAQELPKSSQQSGETSHSPEPNKTTGWNCTLSFPVPNDEAKFTLISCEVPGCRGHIGENAPVATTDSNGGA